jgi:2-polyprenyl-6-hydroxyphenyl methylase/3-demethylubiquinone-9 3-methyltransferase
MFDKQEGLEMSRWDHSSHEKFYDYYAKESESPNTRQRFASIQKLIHRIIMEDRGSVTAFDVVDIGCGAGVQSLMWAASGHRVHGLDINEPLLALANRRAAEAGYAIDFRLGSATDLPWASGSMDVCIAPELLEHVAEWNACLGEMARVLRPGGVLFLTTTNKLCPVQQEFNLPLYSWYPAAVKRYCEHLAVTTRPELANFAKYPAVNWFSFYGLRGALAELGFRCMDRFDLVDTDDKGRCARTILSCVRAVPLLRWCAHVATPHTTLLGIKRG